MENATTGVDIPDGDEELAATIEKEIEETRKKLDNLMTELHYRRLRLNRWVRASRYPAALAAAGLAVVGGIVATNWLLGGRHRGRDAGDLSYVGKRMVAAVTGATAAFVMRHLLERAVTPPR